MWRWREGIEEPSACFLTEAGAVDVRERPDRSAARGRGMFEVFSRDSEPRDWEIGVAASVVMLVPVMAVAGAGFGCAVGRSGVDTGLGGVLGVLFGLVLVLSEWMKAVQAEAAKRSIRFDFDDEFERVLHLRTLRLPLYLWWAAGIGAGILAMTSLADTEGRLPLVFLAGGCALGVLAGLSGPFRRWVK